MKSFILQLILILIISSNFLYGQCLQNGNFSAACGTQDGSATWTDACGDGWIRSHGTPQMKSYTFPIDGGTGNGFYAYMWSSPDNGIIIGEGMFTPYSFLANHSYDVRLVFMTNEASGNNGTVLVNAANGLTKHTEDAPGDAIPVPACPANPLNECVQSIGSYSGTTSSTVNKDDIFSFTANQDYSQLWIYPSMDGTAQYNLQVFYVDACPSCTAQIIYNKAIRTPAVIPAGISSSGTIYAGSSAGFGGASTMTNLPDQNSTLIAANAIYLVPSFNATVTTGSFIAEIVPCNNGQQVASSPDQYDSITGVPVFNGDEASIQTMNGQGRTLAGDAAGSNAAKLLVYPTVSAGMVHVEGTSANLENANITVTNESGTVVYSSHNSTGRKIALDLSNLANGLYFLQVRNSSKTTTLKIIINK